MFTFEKIADGIVYYKNIYENPQRIIENVENLEEKMKPFIENGSYPHTRSYWEDWDYETHEGEKLVFCKKAWFPSPSHIAKDDIFYNEKMEIAKELFYGLESAFYHYSNVLYPYAGRNIKGEVDQVSILRYEKSGYLPEHIDQGISSRVLSVVAYLNDDYDGGEITFTSVGNGGITIKPEAGSAVFFPSNFVGSHVISEVTRGIRYAVPNWYHNRLEKVESDGSE
jgi:hypothetical protein